MKDSPSFSIDVCSRELLCDPIEASVPARLCDRLKAHAQEMPDAIALEWGDEKVTYSALWKVIRALWSVWRDQRRPASAFAIETQLDLDSCLYVIAALAERRRILLVDPALSGHHRKAMIERLGLPDVRVVSQAQAALETAQARKSPPSTEAAPMPSADPETGGYYVFTSGSTGSPKGIRGRLIGLEHFCGWQATHSRSVVEIASPKSPIRCSTSCIGNC